MKTETNSVGSIKYHLPQQFKPHSSSELQANVPILLPLRPLTKFSLLLPTLSPSRSLSSSHNGEVQQQPCRFPQPPNPAPLHPHSRRRDLAEPPRLHRLREVPPEAGDRSRCPPSASVTCGIRRRVLPAVVPPLGLPFRHVRPHISPLLLHHFRLRRYQQRRWGSRLRTRVSVFVAFELFAFFQKES
jgi:hypothetical protein